MNKLSRGAAAFTAVLALTAGGLLTAQAANADEVTPTPTIQLLNATDSPITSGSITADTMFGGITSSAGCPVGYRAGAAQVIAQGGVRVSNISEIRTAEDTFAGSLGLDGNAISLKSTTTAPAPNIKASNRNLNASSFAGMTDGAFELRLYCFASSTQPNYVTDKWYSVPLVLNKTAGTWSYPVATTATTTSLTAAAQSNNTVNATATIKVGASTHTTAAGTVDFLDGATVVCNDVAVASGVANCTTAVLSIGAHSISAVFTSTDPAYTGSTSSASVVYVGAYGAATGNVTVTIPANAGLLTLTGTPNVALPQAVKDNVANVFNSSGAIGTLTVTDTRQTGAPTWNLNGQIGDLTSGASNVIDKKFFGWVPNVTGVGTAGPTVAPVQDGTGLGQSRLLATGAVPTNPAVTTTTANATLNMAAPGNTPAGAYAGTLTITLI